MKYLNCLFSEILFKQDFRHNKPVLNHWKKRCVVLSAQHSLHSQMVNGLSLNGLFLNFGFNPSGFRSPSQNSN